MDRFENLFRQHRRGLFAYILRRTGDYHLAEDLLQQTFERSLKYRNRLEAPLLYTIARNACIDHYRRRNLRLTDDIDDFADAPPQEKALSTREEIAGILRALDRLAQDERELLALVASEDLTYAQIADLTGLSLTNVKVKVHRARQNLRKILQEDKK